VQPVRAQHDEVLDLFGAQPDPQQRRAVVAPGAVERVAAFAEGLEQVPDQDRPGRFRGGMTHQPSGGQVVQVAEPVQARLVVVGIVDPAQPAGRCGRRRRRRSMSGGAAAVTRLGRRRAG
jgi:hypothetical protein